MKKTTLAAAIILSVLVAGCMSGTTETAPAASASPTVKSVKQTRILSADSAAGRILADEKGMTLYMFKSDNNGKSTCYAECAQRWPPFLTTGEVNVGTGVVGKITVQQRDDGLKQVEYTGMPLYYLAQDKNPGDIKGQGVGGLWYVVDPENGPVVPQGGASSSGNAAGGAQPAAATQPAAPSGQFIAKAADVPSGGSVEFTYRGDTALLINIDGAFTAFINKCSHKGAATTFDGTSIVCPAHGSQFDPKTGGVLKGPALTHLTQVDIRVIGDSVYAQ
jgi:predicted lipoprotein with Yx(FWY)xxD motif/nitrite reductase/ring-hydroxylating ferredoxin subunit